MFQGLLDWLTPRRRPWRSSPSPRARARRRPLHIEFLEDRLVPATFADAGTQLNLVLNDGAYQVSVVSNGSNYQLYFHRKLLQESLPKDDRGRVAMLVLMADSVESASRIGRDVDEMFRNTSAPTKNGVGESFSTQLHSHVG